MNIDKGKNQPIKVDFIQIIAIGKAPSLSTSAGCASHRLLQEGVDRL
jgi:hypothetical protein